MNNKKGFTLIELLITITLMLSILGIAIVSIIKVSERKKEEAWKQVQEQIETAAVEYINTNEYLFEGLSNSDGTISVGTLVSDDYLNVVTDPRTGKTISKCAIVKITKDAESYDANFDENTIASTSSSCDSSNKIIISEVGAPSGKIKYYKEDDSLATKNNDWYNVSSLGEDKALKVCVKADTNGNGPIKNATINNQIITYNNSLDMYCSDIKENGKNMLLTLVLENSSGKKWIANEKINKDSENPSGDLILNSTQSNYNSNKVNVTANMTDNLKVEKIKIKNTYYSSFSVSTNPLYRTITINNVNLADNLDGSSKQLFATIYDEAGNSSTISSGNYTIYVACKDNIIDDGTWYNKSGATCSKACGGGTIAQLKKQKDSLSGTACTPVSQNASCNTRTCCSKTKVASYSYGSYSTCTKACGSGMKTRSKTENLVSAYDSSISCGTGNTVSESTTCNTGSCCTALKNASTSNIKNLISVSVSPNYYDKIKSSPTGTTGTNDVTFTFESLYYNDDIKFGDKVAARWCSNKDDCNSTTWHSGWNTKLSGDKQKVTKKTWCASNSPYNCVSDSSNDYKIKYVVACAPVTCGDVKKVVCFKRNITDSNDGGYFSYFEDIE